MSLAILVNTAQAAVTVDSAKTGTAVYLPGASQIAFVVVASAASSPVGTTFIVHGSPDGTSYVPLTTAVTVTGDGNFSVEVPAHQTVYVYYRLAYARTSGSYVATTTVIAKGAPL